MNPKKQMSIQASYDRWASDYDAVRNFTGELDERLTEDSKPFFQNKSVVELGCGTGKNTLIICPWAKSIHAIDFSEKIIEIAKKKVSSFKNVQFFVSDLNEKWPIKNGTADIILCSLVLEHIENLRFIFSEAARILNEKGLFWIRELHPFRHYIGSRAYFHQKGEKVEIKAFTHHISDFVEAGKCANFQLKELKEYWHEEEKSKFPRLISFLFKRCKIRTDLTKRCT